MLSTKYIHLCVNSSNNNCPDVIFTPHFSLSQVGSRNVMVTCGLFMMVLGVIGKFGAFFAEIPVAILGGLYFVVFGNIST